MKLEELTLTVDDSEVDTLIEKLERLKQLITEFSSMGIEVKIVDPIIITTDITL